MDANPYSVLLDPVAADRPALLFPDGSEWSYGDLRQRSGELATTLLDCGVGTGDRVVVQIDKSGDAVTLYLACLRIGAVHVPLNTAYTPAEVQFFVDDAAPALFVGRPGYDAPAGVRAGTLHVGAGTLDAGSGTLAERTTRPPNHPGSGVQISRHDATSSPHFEAADATDGQISRSAARSVPQNGLGAGSGDGFGLGAGLVVERAVDDWAAMLYTSGTTGRPKGAMLSCGNLVSNARALAEAWRFEPDDVLLHVLPVFHVHGLFVALHCAFAAGAAVRFHPGFDLDAVVDDLPRSTVFMGVPTHYHRLLADERVDRDRCGAMRLFTSGSAPLPAHEHRAFTERTGHRIVERYGMTETMITTSNPYDGDRVAGTVGFALPGVDLRIADADGRRVEPGTTGTVEVRGPNLFLGYWGRPERTAEALRPDGWFVTGDIGSQDRAGRVTLAGRSSDVIITGGLNVYPKEIELVLDQVPGVDESAVIGVPDDDFGEEIVAVVVPSGEHLDEAALREACADLLARFKHPRRYVIVEALPRNAMGKVQKRRLRDALG